MKDKITPRTTQGMLKASQTQRTDVVMRFLGASPVVFLAGSTAVPACTARAPLAVPGIEADNAKAGCHEW